MGAHPGLFQDSFSIAEVGLGSDHRAIYGKVLLRASSLANKNKLTMQIKASLTDRLSGLASTPQRYARRYVLGLMIFARKLALKTVAGRSGRFLVDAASIGHEARGTDTERQRPV